MATQRLRVGTMQCPNCLGWVSSSAKACRHCGHAFEADQLGWQAAFENRVKRWQPFVAAGLIAVVAGVGTCTYREATRASTPAELQAAAARSHEHAQFLAQGAAGAIVKERMKNPSSFDLVEIAANPGKTDEHLPCWIVAVTYRGTNSFGGVITSRALVWVSEDGQTPLRVVDIPEGASL